MSNNVPKLRFKGFSDEWKEQRLGDFSTKITRKNIGFNVSNIISNSARNGLISQRDFFDKDIANKNNIDGYYIIEAGDFVYNPRKSNEAPYGPINMFKEKEAGVVSPLYFCFRVNDSVCNSYLENYFKADKWYRYIYMNSDQGARHDRVSIKDSEIMKICIKIPTVGEQEKIANFLTKVDKIIEQQEEKVSNLERYKKGMMQKIFSQEIRFKDENGEEYPEWEKKKLDDFIVEYTEKTTINNQYQVLTSSRRGLFLQSEYFNRQIASEDNTGYNIVPRDYFTYRHMSDDSIFYFNINDILDFGIVSTLYPVFTVKNMNSNFLRYYLNYGPTFRKYCLLQKQGGSRTYMYLKKLREFEGELPCLEEQSKIAKFLYNIDKVVEKEKEKLEKIRLWKKGLLQQMFV